MCHFGFTSLLCSTLLTAKVCDLTVKIIFSHSVMMGHLVQQKARTASTSLEMWPDWCKEAVPATEEGTLTINVLSSSAGAVHLLVQVLHK